MALYSHISNDVVTDGGGPVLLTGTVVKNQRKSVGFSPECSGEDKEYFHCGRISISENLFFLMNKRPLYVVHKLTFHPD